MITFIRKALTSWFALGLLGLVLVAFAVTGVGDPFGTRGGASGSAVARVGSTDITDTTFLSQFDRILRQARQTNPKATAADAVREGVVGQVLEQLIATTALESFGTEAGLRASDRSIDGEIASIPAFQSGGKFDQATYQRLLQAQRISEKELRDGLRGDLIRKQLVTPLTAAMRVPVGLAAPYAALLLEKRSGSVGIVPAAAMPAPPAPTPAQLDSYYKANAARYTIPERRSFRYALLDRDSVAAGVTVSDADIQKYYDANRETLGGVEQRQLLQVVVPDEAKAKAFVAAVRGGSPFATEAAKLGFAATDTDLGLQSQAKFAGATSKAVAAAAFAAPVGKPTEPVKSDFGWHVVEVARIDAPRVRSLADARAEITATLRKAATDRKLSEVVGRIEDALGSGTAFVDVAKANGLTVAQATRVTRDGSNPDAPGSALPQALQPLVAKAFDADPSDGASMQPLGKDQFVMLEPGDIVRPTPVPLARVHDAVAAAWADAQRLVAAQKTADAVVASIAKGSTLDAALAAVHLPPAKPVSLRRIDVARAQQVPAPLQLFLTLPAGGSRALAAPQAAGYWVVHVDRVEPGDAKDLPALTANAQSEFGQSAPDELAAAFAQAVERQAGVSRNPAAIDAVTRRLLGTAGK